MSVDLQAKIDGAPFSPLQFGVAIACFFIAFVDGLDFQIIGFTAPLIAADLGIPHRELGWIFSAGLTGLTLGSFVFSPLGDYVGRRTILSASLILFGLLVFATPIADSTWSLIVIRFFTGIGIGGAMPNAVALMAEYSPQRHRGLAITITYIGFSVGAGAGGIVAAALIGSFGWQMVFFISGLVPVLYGLGIYLFLPESPHFLASRGASESARIAKLLDRIAVGIRHDPKAVYELAERSVKTGAASLFRDGRARNTLLLWSALFLNLLGVFALINWGPTLINRAGTDIGQAIEIIVWFWVGGIAGGLALVWLSRRFGPRRMLAFYLLAGSVCVGAIGLQGADGLYIFAMVTLAGAMSAGAQVGFYPVLADIYPAPIRVTGIGWAQGLGRMGSIAGPLTIGALVAIEWPFAGYFLLLGLPILLSGIVVLLLDYR